VEKVNTIPVIYAGVKAPKRATEKEMKMMKKQVAAKKPMKKYAMGGTVTTRSFGSTPSTTNSMPVGTTMTSAKKGDLLGSSQQQAAAAPARQMPPSQRALPKRRGPVEMAKGGAVKGKKPAAGVAIMIAMPAKGKGKTKMAMGGCATKKK
jgi:hypothetical protein